MCNQLERSHTEVKLRAADQSRVLRVLVVEDNTDAAESLALLLKLWGYMVYVAYDGAAALEMARIHQPAVVLLDIGLPGMDGYEVARRLRGADPVKPLLWAITGYEQEDDRLRSQEAGFDQHLVKPVDLDALEVLLAQSEWLGGQDAHAGRQSSSPTAA